MLNGRLAEAESEQLERAPPGRPEVVQPWLAWGGAHTVVLLCPAPGGWGTAARPPRLVIAL